MNLSNEFNYVNFLMNLSNEFNYVNFLMNLSNEFNYVIFLMNLSYEFNDVNFLMNLSNSLILGHFVNVQLQLNTATWMFRNVMVNAKEKERKKEWMDGWINE